MKKSLFILLVAMVVLGVSSSPAYASLSVFKQYTGTVGYSTDGFGSTGQVGTISASVPFGATVIAAYLYSSTFSFSAASYPGGGTLNGNAVTYTPLGVNSDACCRLEAGRADVTSIVKPLIDGGPGGIYDFTVAETSGDQDGEALVVIYTLASLPTTTIGILDGFSLSGGDSATISFADPLHPGDSGFQATMVIGDGFSCCDVQRSTISVNGTTITENAGNNDDGIGSLSNGQLITVGGFDDPFSAFLPSYAGDHEKYNIAGQISDGSTSILVKTFNTSLNDNIFLEVFQVTGEGQIHTTPEPSSLLLLGAGLLGLAKFARRRIQ